jgi:adenosylmethionine-8-amino-7-oxononanoate aminotransferase
LSIEFVQDKVTKETFPVTVPIAAILDDALFTHGVSIYSGFGKGTADGIVGDHILFSPPLTITSDEVQIVVAAVKAVVNDVFRRLGQS